MLQQKTDWVKVITTLLAVGATIFGVSSYLFVTSSEANAVHAELQSTIDTEKAVQKVQHDRIDERHGDLVRRVDSVDAKLDRVLEGLGEIGRRVGVRE